MNNDIIQDLSFIRNSIITFQVDLEDIKDLPDELYIIIEKMLQKTNNIHKFFIRKYKEDKYNV